MPRSKMLTPPPMELVTIEEAAERLGRGYSRSSVYRRIESGEWMEGVHWVNDCRAGAKKRIIKINLAAIEEVRRTPAGRR